MIYPEWTIRLEPDPINYDKVVAVLKYEMSIHRYPFQFLERIGLTLKIVTGGGKEEQIRMGAYQYAKRRGWKIRGIIIYDTAPGTGERFSCELDLMRVQ